MPPDPKFGLSRRKVLGALGTVGVASAGAGLGTSAFFSDQETYANNQLTAGELDMKVGWEEHYSDWSEDEAEFAHMENGSLVVDDRQGFMNATLQEQFPDKPTFGRLRAGLADPCSVLGDVPDDLLETGSPRPVVDLQDVKPGDFGELTLSFALCDNPGYVWLNGRLLSMSENGVTEPEADDADEVGVVDGVQYVELLDAVEVTMWYDDDGDNWLDGPEDANLDAIPKTVEADIDGDAFPETVETAPGESVGSLTVSGDTVTVGVGDGSGGTAEHDATKADIDGDGETEVIIHTTSLNAGQRREFDIDADGDVDIVLIGVGEKVFFEGSLWEALTALSVGIPLDGNPLRSGFLEVVDTENGPLPADGDDPGRDCFLAVPADSDGTGQQPSGTAPGVHHIGLRWELPVDHGNEIQTDSVAFDLGFYTEQCRHNSGGGLLAAKPCPCPESRNVDGTLVAVPFGAPNDINGDGFVCVLERNGRVVGWSDNVDC